MSGNRNTIYYITAAGLFILLKFTYTFADTNDLAFLIAPSDKLVGLITGSQSVFIKDIGYYHNHLNIIIDKSCSGFNFMLICFLMLTFLSVKYFTKTLHKVATFCFSLFAAYLITILTNSFRILASLTASRLDFGQLNITKEILHEGLGIVTNLTVLVCIFLISEKLLKKNKSHAKLA